MLVLGITQDNEVYIDIPPSVDWQHVKVVLTRVGGHTAHVGFEADRSIKIRRSDAHPIKELAKEPA